MTDQPMRSEHLLSVVIPVYGGQDHIQAVVDELEPHTRTTTTAGGRTYRVAEVILVHDGGHDDSPRVMRELAATYGFVRNLWMSRNYGQHAATLAGIASTGGDWVVTMDEDGQHDPQFLGGMLDVALEEQAKVVYAKPVNPPHHSAFRNITSRQAKKVVNLFSGGADATQFQSYRLILGEVGRSIAAYSGSGVYLDVALGWVVGRAATAPVELRPEGDDRQSSYSLTRLLSHFLRMVLTGGTRGLRMVSLLGLVFATLGIVFAIALVIQQIVDPTGVRGWTSTIVMLLFTSGATLFSLGVIAEYIGVAVNTALGKPLYLLTQDPADSPLGRDEPR
ncbi:MAG: mannosyltransferase [Marmoricola sp.]|nr:mannosyltransferase [Marmoricola sp.]